MVRNELFLHVGQGWFISWVDDTWSAWIALDLCNLLSSKPQQIDILISFPGDCRLLR